MLWRSDVYPSKEKFGGFERLDSGYSWSVIEGYLVIEDFTSQDECKQLMCRMGELVHKFDPSQITVFSTTTRRHSLDNYFYESADNISFFFEEKAFDEQGQLKQSKEVSINKVGHALHEKDPLFTEFSQSSQIADVFKYLNLKKPVLIQSMYIFKQPGIGGEVVPHQDSTFLYSDPPSLVGLWIALEDATKENGCLWALPKSHRGGLKRRYVKDANGGKFIGDSPEYDYSEFVPLEMKAGSLVVLHGSLVHQSFENKSPKSRHAYSIHAFDADGSSWAPENWVWSAMLGTCSAAMYARLAESHVIIRPGIIPTKTFIQCTF
ncbi:hypothetical protein GOP47_0007169 [Adiantum capillus-veneris]|uniref:Phytanoyl-CoA dioxygenase n=1 Tax=Adiantum capillus-veneris TaxID=13818 RepID=A0A9D4V0T8_ADICA|nr:hypothetical protein GOP47_0007169 [Adiantum capillus-veneris]